MPELPIRCVDCRRAFRHIRWILISLIISAGFIAVSSADDGCGGTIQAQNGTITFPSSSSRLYLRNQRCVWNIMAQPQYQLTLNFTRLDLEKSSQHDHACIDVVVVRSVLDSGETFEHGRYCGPELPRPINSRTNHLRLEFTSDHSVEKSGFDAVFMSTEGDGPFTSNHSIDLLLTSKDPLFYEYDFDPVHIEQKLVRKARFEDITPEQYRKDLKLLIGSHRTNLKLGSSLDQAKNRYKIVSALPDAGDPSEVGPRPFPDTITPTRLILMFPEYFRFDLVELDVGHFSPQCQKLNGILPKIMKYPEFAGLIPTANGTLKETERNALIAAHLYWQFCNVVEGERSDEYLEKLGSIAMKRIELSQLPNELRIKVLRGKRILEDDDRFFGTDLELSKHVPSQVHYVANDFPNFAKI